MPYQRTRVVLAIAVLVLAVATSTNASGLFRPPRLLRTGTNSGDGCNPTYSGIVAQGRDGNMYGTTSAGGAPIELIGAQYSRSSRGSTYRDLQLSRR